MNIVEIFFYYFIATFLVISLVVFVHEMGHYLTARYYKFAIRTFSVGFGREVWGRTDKNGTRWKLSVFPLGGYVIIDDDHKPIFQRAVVTIGGPLANFIFFIVLLLGSYSLLGQPVMPKIVSGLSLQSKAMDAHIKLGDELLKINGNDIPDTGDELRKLIKNIPTDTVDLTYLRDGEIRTQSLMLSITKDHDDFGVSTERRRLGVLYGTAAVKLSGINAVAGVVTKDDLSLTRNKIIAHFDKDVIVNIGDKGEEEDILLHPLSSLNQDLLKMGSRDFDTLNLADRKFLYHKPLSFSKSVHLTAHMFNRMLVVNAGEFYQMLTGHKETKELGGIVKVGEMTGQVTSHVSDSGLFTFIHLIAILSAEIGLFNLLPFPVLDGGNLAFLAYEAIRKKPPHPKIKTYLNGIAIILLLWIVFITNANNIIEIMGRK